MEVHHCSLLWSEYYLPSACIWHIFVTDSAHFFGPFQKILFKCWVATHSLQGNSILPVLKAKYWAKMIHNSPPNFSQGLWLHKDLLASACDSLYFCKSFNTKLSFLLLFLTDWVLPSCTTNVTGKPPDIYHPPAVLPFMDLSLFLFLFKLFFKRLCSLKVLHPPSLSSQGGAKKIKKTSERLPVRTKQHIPEFIQS